MDDFHPFEEEQEDERLEWEARFLWEMGHENLKQAEIRMLAAMSNHNLLEYEAQEREHEEQPKRRNKVVRKLAKMKWCPRCNKVTLHYRSVLHYWMCLDCK